MGGRSHGMGRGESRGQRGEKPIVDSTEDMRPDGVESHWPYEECRPVAGWAGEGSLSGGTAESWRRGYEKRGGVIGGTWLLPLSKWGRVWVPMERSWGRRGECRVPRLWARGKKSLPFRGRGMKP